ncbi:MAG TPA: sulfite exporter TauE/SafE family protein [Polyangiaceae bacterium]|jgi:hypothetical protein|nr:sulfite exporter TauE/SafE family protein [Polyangiaceae bacterium]
MSIQEITILSVLMVVTGAIGAITGGNSLINVPILIAFGVAPREAIATNMFAVIFMTVSATARFAGRGLFKPRLLTQLCLITAVTSTLGSLLTVKMPDTLVKAVVGISLGALVLFMAFGPKAPDKSCKPQAFWGGLVASAALGVYGGFFSGGYTTLMTVVGTACFGLTMLESVAMMKPVNLVSCVVASIVFAAAGLIDFKLGVPLAIANLIGGYFGAQLALRVSAATVKRLFLATVALFAVKLLGYDVFFGPAHATTPSSPAAPASAASLANPPPTGLPEAH